MIRKQTPSDLCRNHPKLKCVPRNLGDIIDYYTDTKAKPNRSKLVIIRTLVTLPICAAYVYIAFLSQYAEDINPIFILLGLGVMLLLDLGFVYILRRYGTYETESYLCTDGLAEYTYEKKSGQVVYVKKTEHRFNEISYLQRKNGITTISVKKWYSKSYTDEDVPEYTFEFHLNNGEVIEHSVTKEQDAEELSFLNNAEKVWSDYVFEKLLSDRQSLGAPLTFDYLVGGNIKKGYVLVSECGVGMDIDGYENVFAKEMSISSGTITLHFEEKRKINISKDCLLDIAVFFKALNHFYNIDIDYYFEGNVSF